MAQRTEAKCMRDHQISGYESCEISTNLDTFGPVPPSSERVGEVDVNADERRTRILSRRRSSINASPCAPSPQKQSIVAPGRYSIQPSGTPSLLLLRFILGTCAGRNGPELAYCFTHAVETPPITAESLSELNIDRIVTNAQLRHDINFDREIHFRPNVDCSKGRQKINAAEQYWKALVAELELYALLGNEPSLSHIGKQFDLDSAITASQRRIPLIFETIKEILRSILPEIDRAQVVDVLDVPVLMQQIQRGMCDLVGLAAWLAKLLKVHCAPMRDGWVDQMVAHIEDGVRNASAQSIVDGLRELLGILEAMKLDVANHQIRHLRLLLVEDTIQFEQQHHQSRIEHGRIDVESAQGWLSKYSHALRHESLRFICEDKLPNDLGAFVYAFLRSLLAPTPLTTSFPETFNLDLDRLASLRTDLVDQIHLNICLELHTDLLRRSNHHHHQPFSFPSSSASASTSTSTSTSTTNSLPESLLTIIGPPPYPRSPTSTSTSSASTRWLTSLPNLTTHLLHSALPSLPTTSPLTHALHTTLERRLAHAFNPSSPSFAAYTHILLSRLLPTLLADVAAHVDDSPVALGNAFVGAADADAAARRGGGATRRVLAMQAGLDGKGLVGVGDKVKGGVETVVVGGGRGEMEGRMRGLRERMAHLAVLHWRVWGRMVYLVGSGETEKLQKEGLEEMVR
ncbi:MAG: hypothetical protein Q9165_000644 [Trypethelium subeluteriae]